MPVPKVSFVRRLDCISLTQLIDSLGTHRGQVFCLLYRGSFYMEAVSQATPFKNEGMPCKRLETATYVPSTNTNTKLHVFQHCPFADIMLLPCCNY